MRRATLIALVAACALAGVGRTQSAPPSPERALAEARSLSFQFRTGRYELAPQSVAALEAAVKTWPGEARLWDALGVAHLQQVVALANAGGLADIPAAIARARAAHARALELAPDAPEALANHGAILVIASSLERKPALAALGKAQMDRAVELAPESTAVRLQRGFTQLALPPAQRDTAATEADLRRLIAVAGPSRPGDVLHLLLGDLYAETGRREAARAEYALSARPGATTYQGASDRLALLARGEAPPAADVARLRDAPGRDCAMCHGG